MSVDKDTLASRALAIMSQNKITSLCVHKNNKKKKNYRFITYTPHTQCKYKLMNVKTLTQIFFNTCYNFNYFIFFYKYFYQTNNPIELVERETFKEQNLIEKKLTI